MESSKTWPPPSLPSRFSALPLHNPRTSNKNNPPNPNLPSPAFSLRHHRRERAILPSKIPPPQSAAGRFADLPFDVLARVAAAFDIPELWAASTVCRSWREALRPLREAMVLLRWGKSFKHGRGVRSDPKRALESFLKGAERGSAAAMVDAGLMYWEMGRKEEGKRLYARAAELGHPAGQCNLGICFLEANPAEPEEAVKWFYRAAKLGNARAQYSLALCLHKGRGVKCNLREAMTNMKDVNFSAIWDRDVKMIFCELCLKEVELGNRPTTHFNKEGWLNIMKNFKARTGKEYSKLQLKNKWDQIKKDWKRWKELKRGSTGLGWDPVRRTVDASDEWWTEKLQVVPKARKFRFSGIDPEMEAMLDRLFVGVVATGEHVWAPSLSIPPVVNKTKNSQSNEINIEEVEVNMKLESSRGKRPTVNPPKRSKVGAGFLRDQISQLVSTCSSWTSTPATTSTGRSSMAEALKLLDSIPEVYDDMSLYIACVKLLEDPIKREVLLLLDPTRRLPYLRSYC